MAKARPARQSFKVGISADSMDVAPDGDIYLFGGTTYVIHRWATAKMEKLEGAEDAAPSKFGRLLGEAYLAAASYDFTRQRDQAVIVARDTGALVKKLDVEAGMPNPREVATSDDGRLVAVSFGYRGARCGIEIFDAGGAHVQTVALEEPAGGVIFSADGKTLLYFAGQRLHRLPVGAKAANSSPCAVACFGDTPRVRRREGLLFVQWAGYGHRHPAFVVDEAQGRIVLEVPEAEVASFGPTPGTVVVSTGDQVQVLDLKGKALGAFKRDRKTRFEAAGFNDHGFWFGATAGGSFLEVYDFSQLSEVGASNPPAGKKRAPARPPVVLKPKGAAAEHGAKLREAIWQNPTDRDALRVYADWLIEQGGATQGEYMQLRLLEAPTEEQQAKARKLRDKHRGAWLGAARPFVRSWSDSDEVPGFVDRVWCEAPKLVEGFEQVLTLGPRMTITVTSMRTNRRDTEKRLAALPLGRAHELDLSANDLGDAALGTLAPAMKGLTRLRLHQNVFTAKGLETLGTHIDTLKFLSLQPKVGSREVADSFVRAVLSTPGFRSLEVLELPRLYSDPGPSAALLEELKAKLPKLKALTS